MRILLATDHYPPSIGGAQIQSRVLAQELRRRGHDVVVATVWQNDRPAVEDDDGVPVHRLRQIRTLPLVARRRPQHHQPPFPDPVTVLLARRLIREFRPDIVHSYGWFSYSCAAALVGLDVPLLITARDFAYSCANRTLMHGDDECSGSALAKCIACAGRHYGAPKGWIAAGGVLGSRVLLRRKVDAIHSISSFVRDVVQRDFLVDHDSQARGYLIHDMIASIPMPHNGAGEASTRDRSGELPREPFILFIGAFRRVKGVYELLEAYERLAVPTPLVMLGTFERDSPKRFPPGVHVFEDFPHDDVMKACDRCLFGVMPSLWPEPFGTVVCEVMSRGRPVIGTRPGGHADIIADGQTGFLVPRGDVPALMRAMRTLLEDDGLRTKMGEAAKVRAADFAPAVSLSRIEQLYEEIVAARAGG
jgi:glycosyltransferase involved in cell wall biosynthesis